MARRDRDRDKQFFVEMDPKNARQDRDTNFYVSAASPTTMGSISLPVSELNRFYCLAFCKNHHQEYQKTFQKINPTAYRPPPLGYGPEENLWLPEDNLSNSLDLVADFKARTAHVTTSKRKCKN
ncbi:hypothetical protein PROFUN_17131 [Planoprotostelium fungivorum]|uniref:Uncharacterized protein n=1 Tax=Planoprotostelium fungivorum TaxID=1890364 RepID=A0A2P6MMB0_9EUKA|nr:hypothetical protein PROFUN_17131 [Planoprotostelium fungivorum]